MKILNLFLALVIVLSITATVATAADDNNKKFSTGFIFKFPDLMPRISATPRVKAGNKIPMVEVVIRNIGDAMAKGTINHGEKGYMVDVVLTAGNPTPNVFAQISPTYKPGMLLTGGRISRTKDIPAGR